MTHSKIYKRNNWPRMRALNIGELEVQQLKNANDIVLNECHQTAGWKHEKIRPYDFEKFNMRHFRKDTFDLS